MTAPAAGHGPARPASRWSSAWGVERGGAERGSGTVLVLVVMMVLCFTGGAAALLGAAISVRHRAETAADLAALSGASALQRGRSACSAARQVAEGNGAQLATCGAAGQYVRLTVTIRPRGPLARLPAASAGAHAGPVAGQPVGPASQRIR